MNLPPELFFLVFVFIFGFLGYFLLQKENLWFKVVGGTLTVVLILSIPTLFIMGFILTNF